MKKLSIKKKLNRKSNKAQSNVIIMFLTKLGFRNLSVSDKLEKAGRILTRMSGNSNFPLPSPSLAVVAVLKNNLRLAEAAMDGNKLKTVQRDMALTELTDALRDLRAYVENTSEGKTEIILSSGFSVRSEPTKPTILSAPIIISAVNTQVEGQIKLRWNAVKGGKIYLIEKSNESSSENWEFITQSTKASTVINKLTPGLKYYFRVSVVNPAGKSGWSDRAACRPN